MRYLGGDDDTAAKGKSDKRPERKGEKKEEEGERSIAVVVVVVVCRVRFAAAQLRSGVCVYGALWLGNQGHAPPAHKGTIKP